MKLETIFIYLLILGFSQVFHASAQNSKRWNILKNNKIEWKVKPNDNHQDHIEMAGMQTAVVFYYGVENGKLLLNKKIVFPMLRTIPNDTHASLTVPFENNNLLQIKANGKIIEEKPIQFQLQGLLNVYSKTNTDLEISRTLFPSVDNPVVFEKIKLINKSNRPIKIELKNNFKEFLSNPSNSLYGQYRVRALLKDSLIPELQPQKSVEISLQYIGNKISDVDFQYSVDYEHLKRIDFIKSLKQTLILETPNDTINTAFNFAKIRATESIYDTKGGLMHGPGGLSYYAAIWANDQAEYVNPFFPFLGNIRGNESAINAFRHFARFMNPDFKPLPSSIVAEGDSYWNGAKDRGDMAMIAYGASRYALALGNQKIAEELWQLITWCLAYQETQLTNEGVYKSDSDELEGRAPAGKINLSTNSLTYGALISASYLADELGEIELAKIYKLRAKKLRKSIIKYFGANVEGYETFKYYEGNTILRSWIGLPMTMGITERMDETIDALLSENLWTKNGMLTQSGDQVFWDRATLYAFRGFFMNGAIERTMPYFNYYSSMRLLGEHVPYPIEAWPEGGQRHLSAESALYCRVITEGLFQITPTGFKKFSIKPSLPKEWTFMRLRQVKAFDSNFDIEVERKGTQEFLTIKLRNGNTIEKEILDQNLIEIDLS